MNIPQRKGVSPIIATLLLIAIAVSAGVIVYVFVVGLSGSLTKSGGSQVTEQLSMDAYNFYTLNSPSVYLRNTGTATVTVASIYYDGIIITTIVGPAGSCSAPSATTPFGICATGQTLSFSFTPSPSPAASGTSHLLRIVTATGGTFTFSIVAGSSG